MVYIFVTTFNICIIICIKIYVKFHHFVNLYFAARMAGFLLNSPAVPFRANKKEILFALANQDLRWSGRLNPSNFMYFI